MYICKYKENIASHLCCQPAPPPKRQRRDCRDTAKTQNEILIYDYDDAKVNLHKIDFLIFLCHVVVVVAVSVLLCVLL